MSGCGSTSRTCHDVRLDSASRYLMSTQPWLGPDFRRQLSVSPAALSSPSVTPAASSWRTLPSRHRASSCSRASASGRGAAHSHIQGASLGRGVTCMGKSPARESVKLEILIDSNQCRKVEWPTRRMNVAFYCNNRLGAYRPAGAFGCNR